jgi:hypothetical protein
MKFLLCFLFGLASCFPVHAQKDVEHIFPSDQEVNLMMSQANRAMDDYETLVAQGQQLLGDVPDSDKEVLKAWKIGAKALHSNPQGFNSVAGFDIVTMLDDASRNAAIWAGSAGIEIVKEITAGKVTANTDRLITLIQNANSTSTLLYTVSENAVALYTRFLNWQSEEGAKAVTLLQHCTDVLKAKDAGKN